MAEITAALVKQLREMTDSPMMECKKALVEADGDMDKAVDVLRTRGIAKSLKKAGRATNEGAVMAFVSEDGKTAAIAEIKCETDFVSGTDKFKNMVAKVAEAAALSDAADVEALKAATVDGETVEAIIANGIATMGENMTLTRFARRVVENGAVASYIHMGGKIGVLVEINCETDFVANTDAFKELCHNVAMHIAAAAPEFVSKDEIPAEKLEEERRIAREQVMNDEKNSKKPAQIIEKIVDGRIEKYCKEICLLDQPYVKDPDITIQTLLHESTLKTGEKVTIRRFVRYKLGEGIEKKQSDLAAEIAEMTAKKA